MNKTLHTEYGKIEYVVQRKKMKNIRLKIDKGRIIVSCAKSVQAKHIEEFVLKHVQWIMDTQKKIQQKKSGVFPVHFENEEPFHFLGQDYRLLFIPAEKDKTVLNGGTLVMYINDDHPEKREKLFFRWLMMQSKEILEERYHSLYPQFIRQIPAMPKLVYRKMKSRWGSANIHKHIITLNTALVMAPVECIDYVVVHELAHFIHANHSKEFYGVVAEHIPDWKQRRVYLNKHYSLDI